MTQHAFKPIFDDSPLFYSQDVLIATFSQWQILLVEDVEILAKAACFMLQKIIPHITWAQTAQEALALLHQNSYELMLLDFGLPDMDGLELAQLIREQARWDPMRIVALTAQANDTHLALAHEIGLNGFLQKPITATLCRNLLMWLASVESEREFFTG